MRREFRRPERVGKSVSGGRASRASCVPPTVLATTLPLFGRAAMIVDETWHDLDQMAGMLAQRRDRLGAESDERAFLELVTSGIREVARRVGDHLGGPPPEVESASAMGSHDIGDVCGRQRDAHCV
jgi:hypothetical protein